MIQFFSYFQQVLIQHLQSMSLLRKRRNSHAKKYQWEKDKKKQQDKLFSSASLKVVGLFYKTAILVLNSWRKSKLLFHQLIKSTKISDYGLLVSSILDSHWVSYKRHLKSQMNHQKVLRLVFTKPSPLSLHKNSLIRLITLTGVHLSSQFASCIPLLLKERNSVHLVGVFLMSITTLIQKHLYFTLKNISPISCQLLNLTHTIFLLQ